MADPFEMSASISVEQHHETERAFRHRTAVVLGTAKDILSPTPSLAMRDNWQKRVNVKVGKDVSRREVLKRIGAAGSAGGLGTLAGCSAIQRNQGGAETPTPQAQETTEATEATDQGTAQGGGGANTSQQGTTQGGVDVGTPEEAPDYQLVELVPPPTDLNFDEEPPEREITMVTHDASTSFFDPTIAGLHDAADQLGWSANFTGPSSGFSVQEQVSILESAVTSGPDAIATTIADPEAYDNVINRALENDISIVTYNTNALSSEQMREKYGRSLAYTGQSQVGAGYASGLSMVEKLPDDASLVTPALSDPGHSALSARAQGMEMAVRQNSDLELTDRLNYTGNSNEGVTRVQNHLTSNPDLDGIMGADAFSWFIGDALANQGMGDEVIGGGFDLVTETLNHISEGAMDYTIGQDPYSQGYVPTKQLFAYLDRGMPPKNYATGAEVIDSENIEFAMERSQAWAQLADN